MTATERDTPDDGGSAPYEAPELTDYGTIEAWTRGVMQIVEISIII